MNILTNIIRGGEYEWGAILTPKSANFDACYPFSIFNPRFANFCNIDQKSSNFNNFSSKNANLDNFIPKKCNFGQFSTSKSEKYGDIFSQFFC